MELTKSANWEIDEMNYAAESAKLRDAPALAGTVRVMLGLMMMIAGLYFWLFYGGNADGLGLLFIIGSPFVILTDNKGNESPVQD